MELSTKFYNTLLMTGRTEITLLAGGGEQVLMFAVIVFDAGKTLVKVTENGERDYCCS